MRASPPFHPLPQMSSKRSSSFRRAIANGRRTLQREILLDETGLGLYKRFVRYVAYEILPCETDRRWYFHQNRLCPPPVFIAVVTIIQVRSSWWIHPSLSELKPSELQLEQLSQRNASLVPTGCDVVSASVSSVPHAVKWSVGNLILRRQLRATNVVLCV